MSEQSSEHPLVSHRPSLEYLKLMHNEWLHSGRYFQSAANLELIRLVLIGWMERKRLDLSDLAETSGISRQQVMRHVEQLEERGWVWTELHRNRVLVHPTEQLIEFTERVMPLRMEYRATRWRKLLKLMELSPFVGKIGEMFKVTIEERGKRHGK